MQESYSRDTIFNPIKLYKNPPKKLIEKSKDYHNHKPQPTPGTKRKRKMTKTNTFKTKQTNAREAHGPAPSFPSEVITMLKGMSKQEGKEHGKTLKHEAPRSINHKATQNKNNIGTTAIERPVAGKRIRNDSLSSTFSIFKKKETSRLEPATSSFIKDLLSQMS